MKVLFSPQRSNQKIQYKFENDKVIATINNVTDVFDFTNLKDEMVRNLDTKLSFSPVISAIRKNDDIHVELINFIGENAIEEEKFPKWVEV